MTLLSLLVSLPAESIEELLTGHYLSPHNLAGTSEQQAAQEVEIARAYEKGGADCLSVLGYEKYFQCSFDNIEAIRNAGVKCLLLCKEFIVDAWQIYSSRTKGVDAILLIAVVLPDLDIKYMTKIYKLLGLATLVHDEREMDRVLGIEGIKLIGINNRNLDWIPLPEICDRSKDFMELV